MVRTRNGAPTGRTRAIRGEETTDDAELRAVADLVRIGRVGTIAEARVLDAKRGRIVTRVEAFSSSRAPQDSAGSFFGPALTSTGTFAWIALTDAPAFTFEVRYARRGAPHSELVSASTTIETDSLALGRRYLYWRDAGQPHSAELSALR